MKKRYLHLLDYFFVLRPTLFFPVWTISLAGFWAGERVRAQTGWRIDLPWFSGGDGDVFFFVSLLTLLMGAAFLINQLTDVESDRLNNKLYLIASGAIPIRHARVESVLLILFSLTLTAFYHPRLALWAIAIFLLTGWAYSCRPLLLKDRPWGGLFANLGGSFCIFSFGWLIDGAIDAAMFLHATPYVLGVAAVYFLTTIPDLPGDRATGKVTLAVHWGAGRVLRAAVMVDGLAAVVALWLRDPVVLIATLLAWPFFYQAWRRQDVAAVLRTNKYATLILSFLVCYRFPGYLGILLFIYFISRWYYAKRFNVRYPSLRT